MDAKTNHINLKEIEFDQNTLTLEFKKQNSTGGWFLIYAFLNTIEYSNYLGKSFNFSDCNCNAVVLNSDNYLDSIDLIIEEAWGGKEITVSWKYEGQHIQNKELLCILNEELHIISDNSTLQKSYFSSIQELIHELDLNYFFEKFESY